LDFFAGSGTTAQAVLELNKEDGGNRKFILVQLPEKVDEESEAFKAGYENIADICTERIRRVIEKLNGTVNDNNRKEEEQTELNLTSPSVPILSMEREVKTDLGFKVFKLSTSNFKHWRTDVIESEDDLHKMVTMFDTQLKNSDDGTYRDLSVLYELMLKSGYTLTEDIREINGYYSVAGGKLVVALREVNQSIVDEIVKLKPQTCIIVDDLFAANDQLKTNTALQMKDAGVEMVVV